MTGANLEQGAEINPFSHKLLYFQGILSQPRQEIRATSQHASPMETTIRSDAHRVPPQGSMGGVCPVPFAFPGGKQRVFTYNC